MDADSTSPTDAASTPSTDAIRQTRQRIRRSGSVAAVVVVCIGVLLATTATVTVTDATVWTAVTILVAAGVWAHTHRHAAENESVAATDSTRYASLGVPTAVTLARGTVVAAVGGLGAVAATGAVGEMWAWAATIGYGVVAALDWVDGALARRLGRVTALGSRLDTTVDALGLLVAPLAGVLLGQLPWWYLSVGIARYAFVAGVWWRTRTGRPTYDLPPRASRRVLAGIQMAFVPLALAPGVGDPWIPALAGGAAGSLLLGFVRDWLYVSGRLTPESVAGPSPSSKSEE
ncbi:CDP-alcohol phosphatidyltransferase family protein [Haloferax sp. S1W]|uniref:CDP-alcohol phosphatidyltransferase family protein n=1 Tax=Haloferax sp. S1W TaxID=3377110 RepID=UPI0037CCA22E